MFNIPESVFNIPGIGVHVPGIRVHVPLESVFKIVRNTHLSYTAVTNRSGDLWLMPMSDAPQPVAFLQTPFHERGGNLSPNGRWMAYASDESGEFQVYVQPVPPTGTRYLISTEGGRGPRWRGDGGELYYVTPENELMAVDIQALGDALDVGLPRRLFQVPFRRNPIPRNVFDVTADGQRFLVNVLVGETNLTHATVILNWSAELEQ